MKKGRSVMHPVGLLNYAEVVAENDSAERTWNLTSNCLQDGIEIILIFRRKYLRERLQISATIHALRHG